jgi:predicted phage-related endonuclease
MCSKQCQRCKVVKLFSDFQKNARTPDGLQTWCRACDSARRKAKYAAETGGKPVAERRKAAAEAKKADRIAHGKVCTKCDTKKPLLEFRGDSRKLDSKKASCKACENAAIRLRYSVNDEYRQKVRGRASEYRSSQRYLDPIRKEQRRLAKDHERRLRGEGISTHRGTIHRHIQ